MPVHCTLCEQSIQNETDMPRHMKLHAPNKKELMFTCSICNHRTLQKSNLESHMNIHTRDKTFCCTMPGCSSVFTTKSARCRHLANCHSGCERKRQPSRRKQSGVVLESDPSLSVTPTNSQLEEARTIPTEKTRNYTWSDETAHFADPSNLPPATPGSGQSTTPVVADQRYPYTIQADQPVPGAAASDADFQQLCAQFKDPSPKLSPVYSSPSLSTTMPTAIQYTIDDPASSSLFSQYSSINNSPISTFTSLPAIPHTGGDLLSPSATPLSLDSCGSILSPSSTSLPGGSYPKADDGLFSNTSPSSWPYILPVPSSTPSPVDLHTANSGYLQDSAGFSLGPHEGHNSANNPTVSPFPTWTFPSHGFQNVVDNTPNDDYYGSGYHTEAAPYYARLNHAPLAPTEMSASTGAYFATLPQVACPRTFVDDHQSNISNIYRNHNHLPQGLSYAIAGTTYGDLSASFTEQPWVVDPITDVHRGRSHTNPCSTFNEAQVSSRFQRMGTMHEILRALAPPL